MADVFRRGDHVEWNSEAGRVRGIITKKAVSDIVFKGYTHHATKADPQYFIQSDKTNHVALHKGSALRLIPSAPQVRAAKKSAQTPRRSKPRSATPSAN